MVFGAVLIAIGYGLARFAFGLFVPPIRDEQGLSFYYRVGRSEPSSDPIWSATQTRFRPLRLAR